ncbi:MAG TPA: hypothetical protein VM871_05705 [Flavisolibacter sp.]|jgi:hypothetical protein|nr:hypothetical protein [Flavisolibacter sp.]
MKSILLTVAVVLSLADQKCAKKKTPAFPSCVQTKIDEIKKQPRWNPPASVEEYLYKGKRVFLFSSDCCDQYNQLFDESCNYVCAPSGGITGRGDRKCADFKDSAQFVKVVWKDGR